MPAATYSANDWGSKPASRAASRARQTCLTELGDGTARITVGDCVPPGSADSRAKGLCIVEVRGLPSNA